MSKLLQTSCLADYTKRWARRPEEHAGTVAELVESFSLAGGPTSELVGSMRLKP